jgi:cbb3-type cytochrome oxidase subunit 1
MILVVVAFMMNIWLTMRGNWNRFVTSIPLRFVIVGWAAYILVSYQGSHQALRSINLLTHFTQYVPGHAHLSLLFFAASTIMGAMYYIIPRIYKCRIFSRKLANVQFSLYVIGFAFFFGGFLEVGLVQGTSCMVGFQSGQYYLNYDPTWHFGLLAGFCCGQASSCLPITSGLPWLSGNL